MKLSQLHFPKPLPASEQMGLCLRAKKGDVKARHLLVRSNVHFLYRQASVFARKTPLLEIDDFMSAGVVGLLDAIDKFDPALGDRFLPYATFWITHHMRELAVQTVFRITAPTDILTKVFANRFGRDRDELLKQGIVGVEADAAVAKAHGMTDARLCGAERLRTPPASLDQPIVDSESMSLHDVVPDPQSSFEDLVVDDLWVARLIAAITRVGDSLTEKRRVIFTERIMEGRPLAEVGAMVSLTSERVRQIESRLLQQLRGILRSEFPDELGHKPEPTVKRLRKVS